MKMEISGGIVVCDCTGLGKSLYKLPKTTQRNLTSNFACGQASCCHSIVLI